MTSLEAISRVTRRLKRLHVPHAFLGGAIVPLLVDDPALHQVRPTQDVDALVEVVTQAEYAGLEQRLRGDGFANDLSNGAPICRYLVDGCKVDVLPLLPRRSACARVGFRRHSPRQHPGLSARTKPRQLSGLPTFSRQNWKPSRIEAMKITKPVTTWRIFWR